MKDIQKYFNTACPNNCNEHPLGRLDIEEILLLKKLVEVL